jgi:hypothetical protein
MNTDKTSPTRELEQLLQGVLGKECWSVVPGSGSDCIIGLDFGKRVKHDQPIMNPKLTVEQQHYKGEYGLLIYCDWALKLGAIELTTWEDMFDELEESEYELNKVVGQRVVEIDVIPPRLDLDIHFDNGLCLEIRCVGTGDAEERDSAHYIYFFPDEAVSVLPGGRLDLGL